MIQQLESKYTLFDSVDEMLAPKTISKLSGRNITQLTIIPIEEHWGLSGAQMCHVETDNGRFFMKRMSLNIDYIMKATDDTQCRRVSLWQAGILDQLEPKIHHKVVAAAHNGNSYVLLMYDLKDEIFSKTHYFTDDKFWLFLDRLAYIHATFWNDSQLENPTLGLITPFKFSNCFSPKNLEIMQPYSSTPIHEWMLEGWEALQQKVSSTVYRKIRNLANDPQPLVDAMAHYPRTLVHGDYREANFAYKDALNMTIFDWQFGCYTLMTADLLEALVHKPTERDEVTDYYRERLQDYLGISFDDSQWDEMLDLGLCAFALQRIGFLSFFTSTNYNEAGEHSSIRLQLLIEVITNGIKRLQANDA